MKITLITITVLIALSITIIIALGKYSQKGQASGLVNGSLSKCSAKPNCVCSEYIDDADHYIEPLSNMQNMKTNKMVSTIQKMNGIVQTEKDNYIAATFASSIFGFVDDMELRIDSTQGTIHFRSASRVGYGDGGVNSKRVELFKKLYKEQ